MTVSYVRARTVADRQIRKWGAPALLRRTSGDRDCWAMEAQLTTSERNALKNTAARIFLISAVDLAVAPSFRDDALITFEVDDEGKNTDVERPPLRQVAPVAPLAPGGFVVYWEIQVAAQ